MRPSFNSVGIFILGSLTLLASLANAYLEVPCLETNASGHGKDRNITIEFTFFDQANNGSTTCNSSFLPSTANRTYYPGPPYSIACKDADFRWYFNSFDNSSSFSLYLQHSYNDTAVGGFNTLEGTSDTISPTVNANFSCGHGRCALDSRKGPILVPVSGVSGK